MDNIFKQQAAKTLALFNKGLDPLALLSNKQDRNNGFLHYVRDQDDLVGMIAYSLYKFQKMKLLEENPDLRDDALSAAYKEYVMGQRFEDNKREAKKKIALLKSLAVAEFARQKNRRDWAVGIVSGVVASVLAPVVFWAFVSLINFSGVTHTLTNVGHIR